MVLPGLRSRLLRRNVLKRLLKYVRPHLRVGVLCFVLVLFSTAFNLYRPILIGDAMGSRATMSLDRLQREVMALIGIMQKNYYEKVWRLAVDQRVVKTTMDRNGRVVAIHIPL